MSEGNQSNASTSGDGRDFEAFRLLALRYLDGLVSDDEARQLNGQLAANAEYQKFFAALSIEAGMLHEMLLTGGSDDDTTPEFGRAASNFFGGSSLPRAAAPGVRSKRTLYLAIAGMVLFVGAGWWMLRRDPQLNHTPVQTVAVSADATPAVYSLDSGTTRFTLPKIGYIIAEGPAEFSLLSPMRLRLTSGRIQMRVTEESGHGFVVETPYGEVTDQGTEFGLDVDDKGKTGLVVFEGKVDLRVAEKEQQTKTFSRVERLVGGDGVTFDRGGQLDRIMSIVTGKTPTFRSGGDPHEVDSEPLIAGIKDNLRASDTKRFYEIVRGGFKEDARAYVDRAYEWNGVDEAGLPEYLVGADYILPFNDDKRLPLNITLSLARPATVYILFDDRGAPPKWLTSGFVHTGDYVGMDEDRGPPGYARPQLQLQRGVEKSVDYAFSVWKHDVATAGKIKLGSREGSKGSRSMYGIVVVPLKTAPASKTGL